jgi:hypothetical protein
LAARVPQSDIPPQFHQYTNGYERFTLREPAVYGQKDEVYKLGDDLLWCASQINFQLVSAYSHIENGMPRRSGFQYGCCVDPKVAMNGRTMVYIGYELIEPLLRRGTKYTDAERMVDNFRLACTVLHETTVCNFPLHLLSENHFIPTALEL